MLEGLVTWVLNNYLGKYVENLNTDQLSIALLSGEVELENLPLRREALRHLGLPVEVRAGFLGKVRLQVPVRQIRSAPWVIQIHQLYLVATPVNLAQWDSEAEECMAQEYKLGLLDALEAQWRAENEASPDSGYYATSISSWMNYGTSLVTNIIENLQLKIKDVHIRYEDSITCGESNAFACGLLMESFCAESCDSNWLKSFTTLSSSQSGGCSFKLLELDKMAFYWDRMKPEDSVADLSLADLAVKMSGSGGGVSHDFVVSPVSAFAQLKRERTELPLRSHTRPRLTCQLQLENVNLMLNNRQYNEMMGCERGLCLIGKLRVFKQWRPNISPQQDAKAWWYYAVRCHMPEATFTEERPTWNTCLERGRMCVRYVALYAAQLATPTATPSTQDKLFKEHFEWSASFQQLKLLRESAMRQIPSGSRRSVEKNVVASDAQGRSMLMRWFPQWWGWYGSQDGVSSSTEEQPTLEGEILDVLADSIENNTLLRRDAVFGRFKFNLSKGSLQLCEAHNNMTAHNKVKLELQFENVGFSIESRPRTSSHTLSMALGAVYVKDYCTENTFFPILIAPQGTIREGLGVGVKFPLQVSTPSWVKQSMVVNNSGAGAAVAPSPPPGPPAEPLFQLVYEQKPPGGNSDFRLFVKSQSLEIVYNPGAAQWLVEFLTRPLEREAGAYAHVKHTTKMHLMNQWEHILKGNLSERNSWQLELDISAPQILLIEKFTDRNGVMVLIDFGKMHLTNGSLQQHNNTATWEEPNTEEDDTEMFMTPCSTPPGSQASDVNLTDCGTSPLPADPPATSVPGGASLDQDALHHRLYERYKVELSDLQVLVGRVRDNWKYANTKGTSSLHILDRFNISLQVERRVIYTSDPQFPSVTLCGTLPNLVVHLNEHKLLSIQALVRDLNQHHLQIPTSNSFSTLPLSEDLKISPPSDEAAADQSETEHTERSYTQMSRLFMLQFHVDQMALEVQSRGRSIAEVQVCGVRASFTKRPYDYSLSLSVHSLLLVDALQTYGADFELLIASHKHVGMDSVSGSIRDSEPTSPTSPSSPPPSSHPPPPAALSQALHHLNTSTSFTKQHGGGRWCVSPSPTLEGGAGIVDSEALIVLEVMVVTAQCPSNQGEELRVANILFNNLDIIANQETIVELIGFAKRVTSMPQPAPKRVPSEVGETKNEDAFFMGVELEDAGVMVRTEVTFDFHRLSVLLLRASLQDGELVGRKIATATMSDAKIQATVANRSLVLCGSLGGLQVVSLCPGAGVHPRIVSVGLDPLHPHHHAHTLTHALTQEIYSKHLHTNTHALSFHITRSHQDLKAIEAIDVEAKNELNVGISIHMASVWYTHSGTFIGELQSCATQFTQYLSNLARSIRAAATDMAIGLVQPRTDSLYSNPRMAGSMEWSVPKRPRSISIAVPQDYQDSTCDLHSPAINLKVEVVLDTPVIVLPRAPTSPEVFVAHLGNISFTNRHHLPHCYNINIKDINVYSLDISSHLNQSTSVHQSVESIYSCGSDGKPILHDTTLHFTVEREPLPVGEDVAATQEHCMQVVGKVVTPLVVSSSRRQYEQLLDTVSSLGVPSNVHHHTQPASADTLDHEQHKQQIASAGKSFQQVKVHFQLPIFTVELRGDFGEGERSLVDLSFREFFVNYDKCQSDKTNIEMSLRSITMEDLSREVASRHRFMMVSHKPSIPKATYVSKSCPDLTSEEAEIRVTAPSPSPSLPDHLHTYTSLPPPVTNKKMGKQMSLAQDNLVLISIEFRETDHPDFKEKYKNVRKVTKVDFNSLDLVVSVDSWVVVLDFFGMGSDEEQNTNKKSNSNKTQNHPQEFTTEDVGLCEMEMSVRSLNIMLLRPSREVCRANISGLEVLTLGGAVGGGKHISGTLHSMSLTDLTPHGRIWRERFISSGKEALNFQYERFRPEEALLAGCDTRLLIEMSSITYIHTKRFVAEIQSFFREFSRLQAVLSSAHQKVSVTANSPSTRLQLSIQCLAPAILVPVSSASTCALVADLGKLTVTNVFKRSGSMGTISTITNPDDPTRELLDVMTIHLDNMDLYCGEKVSEGNDTGGEEEYLSLGQQSGVARRGPCLLTHKCGLTLQVERNLEDHHNVADMTIQGTLDTLDGAIDSTQYRVIKGLLGGNLGENIDDLVMPGPYSSSVIEEGEERTWTLTSIRLELLNVTLRLETRHATSTQEGASLACINFIKSHLLVETFSDMTQDIDLVSQEILVSDTRYKSFPVNKRFNVFSHIVQPMGLKMDHNGVHSVQAEVHARKRKEHSAYTILVNNMRLMAIIDWWQAVNEFIMSPPTPNTITILDIPDTRISHRDGPSTSTHRQSPGSEANFELKLNITESQVVFVEDTSQWDTNAVILKSTTVISYKPGSEPKPLSCVLNHCEVFSCVLGMEDETALSIIDPVTVQIDLSSTKVLQVQIPQLSVRLSYHDVRMLMKMFQSLPQQTRSGRAAQNNSMLPFNHQPDQQEQQAETLVPANLHVEEGSLQQLCGMGFSRSEASWALARCGNTVEQAALMLAEHSLRTPPRASTSRHLPLVQHQVHNEEQEGQLSFHCVQVKADCMSLCVIDDCRDCDVPLVEISLSEMHLVQDMRPPPPSSILSPPLVLATPVAVAPLPSADIDAAPGGGRLQCKLTSDYYNRALSGWEPFIEPWRCEASWEYGLSMNLKRNRLQVEVNSTERLNINVTSSLVELYGVVKASWSQDYYAPRASPPGPRRRSPFVPFALLNQTGCKLSFTTIVTTPDIVSENVPVPSPEGGGWMEVPSGDSCPFTFGARGKQRHRDSHKLRLHQLAVHIQGWGPIPPVCVDKVGVFFRQATHIASDIEARIVFSVSLEGSAKKLVTVRSALQLVNQLPETIEVRADNISIKSSSSWSSASVSRNVCVKSGETWCVPLSHNPTPMWVRPVCVGNSCSYLYCAQPLDWRLAARQAPEDTIQLPHCCHSNTQSSYRFCCIMKREQFPLERGLPQPGHVLVLKPPVRLLNLLPVEINYKLILAQGHTSTGRVAPGQTAPLSQVDVQKSIEINVYMEGFPGAGNIVILPTATASFSCKLRLSDMTQRKLTLNAYVSIKRSDTIKVSISAPYWIVNRTGVPIVFRQEGVTAETAGQFEEHEIARMVAPLLFSFADSDGSPTVVARVGAGVIPNGQPQWCSPFGLGVGVMVRRLVVGGSGERALLVGIAVRPGKGHYRHTNICTISPRFQIHNNTSFHLQFAQKCYATTMNDPGAAMTQVSAIPGCSMPFHWPRPDREQLLCVRILDLPNCTWSGGFRVDMNHSLHINVRDNNATCFFLRLEVVLQAATYFIVFTDADTMPPPIRLDNYSLVPLKFHQVGCKEEYLLKAHSSKPWALVEACGAGALGIKAPGGTGTTIDLHKLDAQKSITYQNFIYIAFTGTHLKTVEAGVGVDVESLQLVLCAWGVSGGGGGSRVVLGRRREGERAQLWRRSPQGHLLHEGSSPPQPANSPPDISAPHALVLDIEGSAVQPGSMVGLCLRRVNARRASTQTWNFTQDGRLTCAHRTMCVQPQDGFFGLREGARAVLGMPGTPGPHLLPNGVPIEQAVSSQTLRPGSGFLSVTVETDGPTRVVKIVDSKLKDENWCEGRGGECVVGSGGGGEVQLRVAVRGVGVSIVQRAPPLELVYAHHKGVLLEAVWTPTTQALNLSVQDMQYDNQLLGTPCPVLLHSTRLRGISSSSTSGGVGSLPIVQVSVERATPPSPRQRAHIFQHLLVTLRPLSLHLEERLLLLLAQWLGLASQTHRHHNEDPDEADFEAQKILSEVTAAHAKRYYFRVLKLQPNQIRLSMQTAGKLPPKLSALKKRLGLTLIKFEDAGVELEPFVRLHPFETSQFLWHAIIKHYKDELKWQAAIILGSVDFLGNPLGFVQDVSDGVSGLIYEGNVGALVKNVTHGISNSAAKVSESLGDGLGRVILDEAHEETRARIRGVGTGGEVGPSGHLAAGLRGLGLGLLGGMTSLVKHSYEGAQHQGLPGFLAGVGKGLVGTLTKPVVGVLDLAAETAAALRDTSRSERWIPERLRPPRCPLGPGGLLPRYSRSQSVGRQLLHTITQPTHSPTETFLAYDTIRSHPYDIRALVSTTHLRIFTCTSGDPHIVIESHLSNIISCQAVSGTVGEHYIELVVRGEGVGGGIRRPQVQCDTGDQARWVTHQLNYAKSMYHETLHTLQEDELECD